MIQGRSFLFAGSAEIGNVKQSLLSDKHARLSIAG